MILKWKERTLWIFRIPLKKTKENIVWFTMGSFCAFAPTDFLGWIQVASLSIQLFWNVISSRVWSEKMFANFPCISIETRGQTSRRLKVRAAFGHTAEIYPLITAKFHTRLFKLSLHVWITVARRDQQHIWVGDLDKRLCDKRWGAEHDLLSHSCLYWHLFGGSWLLCIGWR